MAGTDGNRTETVMATSLAKLGRSPSPAASSRSGHQQIVRDGREKGSPWNSDRRPLVGGCVPLSNLEVEELAEGYGGAIGQHLLEDQESARADG